MANDLSFLNGLGTDKSGGVKLTTIAQVLEHYGQLFIDATKRNLELKKKNADYKLSQSIGFEVEVVGLAFRFTLSMEDYYIWVDEGRKPGKRPPLKPIIEWLFKKPDVKAAVGGTRTNLKKGGMSKLGDIVAPTPILRAALAIQAKIGREGTKGSHFFSDVVNEKSLQALNNDLSAALGKDVEVTIKEIEKEINKK